MKEYTFLTIISVLAAILLNNILKIGLLRNKLFYLFLLIIIGFKFLVNGFLTGKGIVLYNPKYFLSIRAGSIPLEDFLFGFSMVLLTIIFWEHFKRRQA
ncbi:MAG: lycopene cyclase domain-containing protein [Candidatus Omnitrophica bacterium]|nr:lycopene cyclase domain-containing protein [Candidatus Omnitrophota bacterium]